MKRLFALLKSRRGLALYCVLCSVLLTLVLGGLISILTKSFIFTCSYLFFLFFAFPCVSALLLVVTKMKEELTFAFGAGLYYGTLAVALVTQELGWQIPDFDRIVLAAIISALVCYIVYTRKFKNQ